MTGCESASGDLRAGVGLDNLTRACTLAGASAFTWKTWLAAFLLFRAFDIWKPFPVRNLEALPGGLGINADDAMAGVYAALVLSAAGWFNLV